MTIKVLNNIKSYKSLFRWFNFNTIRIVDIDIVYFLKQLKTRWPIT